MPGVPRSRAAAAPRCPRAARRCEYRSWGRVRPCRLLLLLLRPTLGKPPSAHVPTAAIGVGASGAPGELPRLRAPGSAGRARPSPSLPGVAVLCARCAGGKGAAPTARLPTRPPGNREPSSGNGEQAGHSCTGLVLVSREDRVALPGQTSASRSHPVNPCPAAAPSLQAPFGTAREAAVAGRCR